MSAPEFRDLLRAKVDYLLHGDGIESGGVVATILSGGPKEYPVYRDLCGYHRALTVVLQAIDDTWDELYNPKPLTETKDVDHQGAG